MDNGYWDEDLEENLRESRRLNRIGEDLLAKQLSLTAIRDEMIQQAQMLVMNYEQRMGLCLDHAVTNPPTRHRIEDCHRCKTSTFIRRDRELWEFMQMMRVELKMGPHMPEAAFRRGTDPFQYTVEDYKRMAKQATQAPWPIDIEEDMRF